MLSNAQQCSTMLSNAQQLCSVMLLQIICSLRSQRCKMRLFVWFLPTVRLGTWAGNVFVARNWTVSATKHWLVGAKLMLNFKLINKKRSLDLADALLLHTPWNSKSFNINYLRTFYWISPTKLQQKFNSWYSSFSTSVNLSRPITKFQKSIYQFMSQKHFLGWLTLYRLGWVEFYR